MVGLAGNDTLLGGVGNDTLDGSIGDDQIFSGQGSDIAIGGKGRDRFALDRGAGRDTIRDFSDRQDRLGLSKSLTFGKLDVIQQGRNTLIRVGNDPLALLIGVQANRITAADFTRV